MKTSNTQKLSNNLARGLWCSGDNQGLGYAPYTDVPGADTMEGAISAAIADGWDVVLRPDTTDDVWVLQHADGELMGIGDRHGPWAVDISA